METERLGRSRKGFYESVSSVKAVRVHEGGGRASIRTLEGPSLDRCMVSFASVVRLMLPSGTRSCAHARRALGSPTLLPESSNQVLVLYGVSAVLGAADWG